MWPRGATTSVPHIPLLHPHFHFLILGLGQWVFFIHQLFYSSSLFYSILFYIFSWFYLPSFTVIQYHGAYSDLMSVSQSDSRWDGRISLEFEYNTHTHPPHTTPHHAIALLPISVPHPPTSSEIFQFHSTSSIASSIIGMEDRNQNDFSDFLIPSPLMTRKYILSILKAEQRSKCWHILYLHWFTGFYLWICRPNLEQEWTIIWLIAFSMPPSKPIMGETQSFRRILGCHNICLDELYNHQLPPQTHRI